MKCKQQIIFKANQSSSPYFVGDTILNLGQNPSNSDQTSKNLQVYIGFLIFRYHHIMANLKWSPAKNYATNISPFIYGSKMKQTSVVAKVPIQSFQSYQIFRTLPLCNIPIVWKIDSNLGVIMSIHPSIHLCLVGGFNPSEKYEFVSWDDYSQYMENTIHVPNHQTVITFYIRPLWKP